MPSAVPNSIFPPSADATKGAMSAYIRQSTGRHRRRRRRTVGRLIGLIFLMSLMGLAIGAATGALAESLTATGVDDDFTKELAEKLTPGTSALFLLIRKSTPDKLLPRIEHFGGHVIQTSLSDEYEQQLRAALGE